MTDVLTDVLTQNFDISDKYAITIVSTFTNKNIMMLHKRNESFKNIMEIFFNNYNEKNVEKIGFYSTEHNKKLDGTENYSLHKINHLELCSGYDTSVNSSFDLNKIEKSTIQKSTRNDGELFIKTLTGKTIVLQVNLKEMTINELKVLIMNKEGTPLDQQRIIFAGIEHKNGNKLLSECGIKANCTCHLVLSLRGGMYHETSGKDGNFSPLKDCLLFVGLTNDDVQTLTNGTLTEVTKLEF